MLRKFLVKYFADFSNTNSFAYKLRKKRFDLFVKLLGDKIKKNITILDLGGESVYWEVLDKEKIFHQDNIQIIMLNLIKEKSHSPNMISIVGNAKNLSMFRDKSVDIVFAHSVIQYITNTIDKFQMAKEIERVSDCYFIQTPNYYFPLEPHYKMPFFQFFPLKMKAFILRHFKTGLKKKLTDYNLSIKAAKRVKLLKKKELRKLFPDSTLYCERALGMTKSFTIHKGFGF